jgi:type II secretory pathway component GspD/PulD (secretin)
MQLLAPQRVFLAASVLVLSAAARTIAQLNDVTLPDTIKLSRLVDVAAEVSGQAYSYNPADLETTVTVRVPGGFTREQIPALLSHVLASRGFTTVRTPGSPLLSVVKIDQAAGMATTAEGAAGGGAGFVTQVFEARHLPAKALAEAARSLLSKPGGTANVVGDSNLVAVSDLIARVEEVRALIARLDKPDATVVREVALRHLSAQQAVASIAQVAAKRESAGGRKLAGDVVAGSDGQSLLLVCAPEQEEAWRGLIAAVDRREPVETRTYSPRYFPARDVAKLAESAGQAGGAPAVDDRFRVVVDDLTGSLLVTATSPQHERVAALMERLDSTPAAARRPVRSFVIKNRPVSEVKSIIEELARTGVLQAGAEQPTGPAPAAAAGDRGGGAAVIQLPPPPVASGTSPTAASGASSPTLRKSPPGPGAGEPALSLTIDEGTNTLIAVGEPRLLSQIEGLLRTLDVRQPQVMLEVLMVTLTDNQSRDLGVELEKLRITDDLFIRLSSLFGLGTRNAAGDRTAGDASGFTGVVLSPGDFSVVIRALETLNKGRSVSMPKLLVGNNQQASLDSVVQQPYASVNATNTISTTSFGGTQDAGTVVTIKPQIAEGDHLVLEYSVSLSSFLGAASSPTLPPAKQQNRVQSVATIPDGSTVVVGGIDLESESKTTSQVPFLGDIPLLGEVFKNRNSTNNRSRFFVFIRANVLRGRGFDDLKYLSMHDMEAARVPDGWPEVEPRFIR